MPFHQSSNVKRTWLEVVRRTFFAGTRVSREQARSVQSNPSKMVGRFVPHCGI